MNFRSALAEFVDLLAVASNALTRLARDDSIASSRLECQLAEIEALAQRLREIGEELSDDHPREQ